MTEILAKYAQSVGYTDRGFRQMVELNLRPAYEDRGMYHVKFPSIATRFVDAGAVTATVSVEEGPKYRLGATTLIGEALPEEEILRAANFKKGEVANWTEIQNGIYASERPLKHLGYMNARLRSERVFDDGQHVMNLKLEVQKVRSFILGAVRFQGLTPELEADARKAWRLNPGDVYDAFYPNEFLQSLSKKTNLRQFKKFATKLQPEQASRVMDVTMVFE